MYEFRKTYEDLLKKDAEEKLKSEALTVKELIEFLKQVNPNSIVEIHTWDDIFTIKNTTVNNGIPILFTFKN